MNFFDYSAASPREELSLAWKRMYSDEFSHFGSLRGRCVCLLRVGTHGLSILIKTCAYLYFAFKAYSSSFEKQEKTAEGENKSAQSLRKREEALALRSISRNFLYSAGAAIFSQIIQVIKAVAGILYPGFYFQEARLTPYFDKLATIAKEVGCDSVLIESLELGPESMYAELLNSSFQEEYYAIILQDLECICKEFEEGRISPEQKRSLLTILHPGNGPVAESGINSDAAGIARLFQQIRSNLPFSNPTLPLLVSRYQDEVIDRMIKETDQAIKLEKEWQQIVDGLGSDPVRQRNALIVIIGEKVHLDPEILRLAKLDNDPFSREIIKKISEKDRGILVQKFVDFYNESLMKFLLAQINSKSDGTPGLRLFRKQIVEQLNKSASEKMGNKSDPKEEMDDKVHAEFAAGPAPYVKSHYFLHPEIEDPSDERFADLNAAGIRTYANCRGLTLEVI